jgi:hypothetical protein
MEFLFKNWLRKFQEEVSKSNRIKIISPFVKEQILRKISGLVDFKNFELITRFNLSDFAQNVSSLDGLIFSLEKGARIYGIKDLHSKVYIFDERCAIVTSGNLTSGGLINNYECSVIITEKKKVNELIEYFDFLKCIAGNPLVKEQCKDWKDQIEKNPISHSKNKKLKDFGASENKFDKNKNYYIKFLGSSDDRVELDFPVSEEIDRALCHYACAFPEKKKPRQVKDDDIIYMARLTRNPNDYAIFGKAEAIKFNESKDFASKKEITERPWKKKWPIYLRVKNPIFLNGTMNDCVFLLDLIKEFGLLSFPSTKTRLEKGDSEYNPLKSLMRKAYIKITPEAAEWLDSRFNDSLKAVGHIDKIFLNSLPNSL